VCRVSFIGQETLQGQRTGIIEIEAWLEETNNFYTIKRHPVLQKKIPQQLKNELPWKPLDAIKNRVFGYW
jgi:hypothetical protein